MMKLSPGTDAVGPRDWATWEKVYYTWIPTIVGFLVCFASTSTVPAEALLQAQFGVNARVSQLPFVFFILGLAFGPVAAAPISENYGRKPVYLSSIPAFSAFLVVAGFSPNFGLLVFCRFMSGLFGGSALVVGFGLLADVWDSHQLPVALSIFNTVPFCGPAAGQLVTSFVVSHKSWPWTQWVTLFLAAFTYATVLPMRETRPAATRKEQDSDSSSLSGARLSSYQKVKKGFAAIPLKRPLHMLMKEPVVCAFSIYIAFNFAVVYCFSSSIPYVFRTQYRFGIESQGLVFISLIAGYIISCPTMVIPYWRTMRKHQDRTSTVMKEDPQEAHLLPERLLWPALLASLALPISFFWFGWTAWAKVSWVCPIVGLGLFSWGNNLLYNAAQLYLIETYGDKYGASATAANNLLRYMLATVLPLFMDDMYSDLGVNWAATLLGCILLLFLPIPWGLRHFGPRLRAQSIYLHPKESLSGEQSGSDEH